MPRTLIYIALDYLLKHWDGLTLFLQDGQNPWTNNRRERLLRRIAIAGQVQPVALASRTKDCAATWVRMVDLLWGAGLSLSNLGMLQTERNVQGWRCLHRRSSEHGQRPSHVDVMGKRHRVGSHSGSLSTDRSP